MGSVWRWSRGYQEKARSIWKGKKNQPISEGVMKSQQVLEEKLVVLSQKVDLFIQVTIKPSGSWEGGWRGKEGKGGKGDGGGGERGCRGKGVTQVDGGISVGFINCRGWWSREVDVKLMLLRWRV